MDRLSITHGMKVRSADGKKVGMVESCADEHVVVKPFTFSRHRFALPYSSVSSLEDGDVWLKGGRELLEDPHQADLEQGVKQNVLPVPPGLFTE